jgi:ribosomal protein S12 methylthiotransferase accessory factor
MNLSSGEHLSRAYGPAETVARMRPILPQFGITRVARQTDLDTIGLHCFSAFRPNSKTLSSSQGKGLTEDAARASAIMEAIEYAVAENPAVQEFQASADQLRSRHIDVFDPARHLPEGKSLCTSEMITWYGGRGLITHHPFAVPADLVRLNGHAADLKGICQNTNGLAAGNTEGEAIFHGLCELIERDAQSLWLLRPQAERLATALSVSAFGDSDVVHLAAQIERVGLQVRLFDQTTDLGIPVIMAIIGEDTGNRRKFDLAAGYGAHPLAKHAAIRALTEAAQTRVTSIAGARDDIAPSEYADALNEVGTTLLAATSTDRFAPQDCGSGTDPVQLTRALSRRLMDRNLSEPVVVPLSNADDRFAVVRILSADLEDAEVNLHWRPGHRALRQIINR